MALAISIAILALSNFPGVGRAAEPPPASTVSWAWTNLTHGPAPPASAGDLLAYDDAANRFIEFGGWNGTTLNETWTLDPTTGAWTWLHPSSAPPVRADAAFVYDSVDGNCYLFGGWTQFSNGTYVRYDDMWSFSLVLDRWTELFPSASPSPRSDSAVAFDPVDDRITLVGGFSGSKYLGDEWSYSPRQDTWTPLGATGTVPSPRADGRMVYDPAKGMMILFGGNDYSGPNLTFHHLDDTWSLSLASGSWTEIPAPRSPPARDYAIQAFDTRHDWVLLTAGFGNGTILNDLWVFSPTNGTWWPVELSAPPPARYAGVGGYDALNGTLIVSGGAGSAGLLNDTWSLGPLSQSSASPGTELILPLSLTAGTIAAALAATVVLTRKGPRPPITG
jgi:Galactose oxidase, central domain